MGDKCPGAGTSLEHACTSSLPKGRILIGGKRACSALAEREEPSPALPKGAACALRNPGGFDSFTVPPGG